VGERRNEYRILMGYALSKTEMALTEIDFEEERWTRMAEDRFQWQDSYKRC
jgi:hypothetical protein